MKPDRTEIAALSIAAFCGLVLPTKIVFNDIGLREAVTDNSVLRARFYMAIGGNPERYNIAEIAYKVGNCKMMEVLQNGGASMERLYERYGLPAHCGF